MQTPTTEELLLSSKVFIYIYQVLERYSEQNGDTFTEDERTIFITASRLIDDCLTQMQITLNGSETK